MQIHRNLLLISLLVIIAGCNGIATKAETDEVPNEKNETSKLNTDLNSNNKSSSVTLPDSTSLQPTTDPNIILANIDQFLVSRSIIPETTLNTEGISGAMVTIQNSLNFSFQKIIVEVSILLADDKEYRTDYYTLYNIEPASTKTIKIPNTSRGVKIVSHVIKVKSNELTNGEWILTGNRFVPK